MNDITVVICGTVGFPVRAPTGSQIRSCHGCRAEIWVSPSTLNQMGMQILRTFELWCMTCRFPAAGEEVELPVGQLAELDEVVHGVTRDDVERVLARQGWTIKKSDT